MHASQGSLVVSPACLGQAPYVFGSAARKLPVGASSRDRLVVISGGSAGAAHACRDRPTARDVARDQRLRLRDVFLAAALVLVACAVIVLCAGVVRERAVAADVPTSSVVAYESVAVQPGDTLWELAAEHPVRGLSTQDVVDLLAERNGLSGAVIQPGQVILVPVGSAA